MVTAGKKDDIKIGGCITIESDDRHIVVFRKSDEEFFAIDNICPHQGAPLDEGYLEGYILKCPWHAWDFDIRTGSCSNVPEDRINSYPVQIKDEEILVKV